MLGYLMTPEGYEALRRIKTRLYDGTTLTYDQRRDLARNIARIIDLEIIPYNGRSKVEND